MDVKNANELSFVTPLYSKSTDIEDVMLNYYNIVQIMIII